jgi:hypothetical protein
MKLPCGCCSGIEVATPVPELSRPGLTAIPYRVGTYATFYETMLARLSSLYLDVAAPDGSGTTTRVRPLQRLTTRDNSDPSIALLDAWAVVADVLTFYEERIANEGYLPTAVERRSILELARLIGYKLRPGVAASVYLAFTVANGFQGVIPAGTRAQSVPAAGQTAQYFETSIDLDARDTWNAIKARTRRPQVITLLADPGTDAATRETVYLDGISTNLKQNDALLFVLGERPGGSQVLRFAKTVNVQADDQETEVVLQEPLSLFANLKAALQRFKDEADSIFSESDIAASVKALLEPFFPGNPDSLQAGDIPAALVRLVPQIEAKHDVAVRRKFSRLEPWLADLLDVLQSFRGALQTGFALVPGDQIEGETPAPEKATPPQPNISAASALGRLLAIVNHVALPQSVQPANSQRLPRSVSQAFARQTDIAPRLLTAFYPTIKNTIYSAWSGTETPESRVTVHAFRVKASLFPGTYSGQTTLTQTSTNPNQYTATFTPPTLQNSWGDLAAQPQSGPVTALATVALDATYDKIVPGTWVAVVRPVIDSVSTAGPSVTTYHKVTAVQTLTRSTNPAPTATADGYTGKITLLTLNPPWLYELAKAANGGDAGSKKEFGDDLTTPRFLRETVVYAQSELLDLTDEPLDADVSGGAIDLDDVYSGLESGQWIVVSGERTDIPDTTGVTASELVMISSVKQGTRAPDAATNFPAGLIPFKAGAYTTDANRFGDRLVVGILQNPGHLTLDPPDFSNQMYSDQIELAPGLYANAYVPTAKELQGQFPDFAGLLLDPETGSPYRGGIIDPGRAKDGVLAWRISTQPVHTILTLANALAYSYDTPTVSINANVVHATHGQSTGEVLGDGDASQAFQSFSLHQTPLTYISAPTPDGAQSTLVARINEIQWSEAPNFVPLGPRDRSFVTQTDDSDQTTIIFGNGVHGTRVPTGTANVKATYRFGLGSSGNVDAQQISQLATHPLGAQGVINPTAATGGADRDSLDQARRNAPVAVMALDRLVSTDDYAQFARTYAGIGKAASARLSDGRRQLEHITIDGAGDIPIDRSSDLYRNLVQSLLQFGDPYIPLQVCIRKLQLLVISAAVQILQQYAWEDVQPQIRAALLDRFSFENRSLGQSAFLSEAITVMQGVPGVSYVNVDKFDAVSESVTASQLAGLAGSLKRKNHILAQLARLNPNFDPTTDSDPCDRVLPAELVFLTPDIPDTLILNPIGGS